MEREYIKPSEIEFYFTNARTLATSYKTEEECVCFRTVKGRGTGMFCVPSRLFPRVVEELKAYNPLTYQYPERKSVFVPGPRGGTGPNSMARRVDVYWEEDPIVSFRDASWNPDEIWFHQWWGRGVKPQIVRSEDWADFLNTLEEW